MLTWEELKQILVQEYDPDELVELMCLSSEQIVDAFEYELKKNMRKFNHLQKDHDYLITGEIEDDEELIE